MSETGSGEQAGPVSARALKAIGLLSAPGLAVLLSLVVLGQLDWRYGLAAAMILVAAVAAIANGHLNKMARMRKRVEALGRGDLEAAAGSDGPTSLCPGLDEAIAQTARERHASRLELESLLAGNEAILENLPDPLIMLDRSRHIVRLNHAAQVQFGRDLKGRDLASAVRHPALLEGVDDVLEDARGRIVDFSMPGTLDRYYNARIAGLPQDAPDGTAVILSLHDMTGVRRAERLRADFVANASHELRTPLSSLVGFVETLSGPAKDDEEARERFLSIMHEQASRMSRLIEDLLSLSRIEMAEHAAPTGKVDLTQVLGSVVGALELYAQEKDMTIDVKNAGLPPLIGDKDELAQVFQNLVDNAIKYGRAGTSVSISSEPSAEATRRLQRPAVAVSVSDQGEGVAPEHISRLTERFYRVDTARSRQLGGTGLGLAIVKHIVNRHRGALEVESEVGKGSTFTVYLPAADGG